MSMGRVPPPFWQTAPDTYTYTYTVPSGYVKRDEEISENFVHSS